MGFYHPKNKSTGTAGEGHQDHATWPGSFGENDQEETRTIHVESTAGDGKLYGRYV